MTQLTVRQHQVAILVADGLTDKQIARVLGCGVDNVYYHITRIAAALNLDRSKNVRVQIANRIAA